jgi:phosphoribosylamine-glycine ligase
MEQQEWQKVVGEVMRKTDLLVVEANFGGIMYKLFIQKNPEGLFSVDFGGRFGDNESIARLLSKLDVKTYEY